MSTTGGDRWRLGDRPGYRPIGESRNLHLAKNGAGQIRRKRNATAQSSVKIAHAVASALSVLLDIYDYVKKLPAADDG